jgi:hypothetical protein
MNLTLYLRDYLLGTLEEENAELIEEAVFVNDDLAARLCIVEDDLVDAYVRGHLTGPLLERFEAFYLASPRRRAKVGFAAQLLRVVGRPAGGAAGQRGH